jgi:hypothetical protein
MLNVKEFYLFILATLFPIFLWFLLLEEKRDANVIGSKVINILLFSTALYLYVRLGDMTKFPDIHNYIAWEENPDYFRYLQRDVLFTFVLDLISAYFPGNHNISYIFLFSSFGLILYLTISKVKTSNLMIFFLGPGFSILFIQYRTLLALTFFLLASTIICFSLRWLKVKHTLILYPISSVSFMIHSAMLSSFIVMNVFDYKVSFKKLVLVCLTVFTIVLSFVVFSLYPSIADYSPILSPATFGFLLFNLAYVFSIVRNNEKISKSDGVNLNLLFYLVAMILAFPVIQISTRLFAVYSSIILLNPPWLPEKEAWANQSKIIGLSTIMPSIYFYFFSTDVEL